MNGSLTSMVDLPMGFNDYSVEEDPTGAIGMSLVDAALKRSGMGIMDFIQARSSSCDDSDNYIYWSNLVRVALPRFSELGLGESINSKEIRERLRDIRKAGYEVPTTKGMKKDEIWDLLKSCRRDIRAKSYSICPEVVSEINSKNDDQKSRARDFR